MFTGIISGTGHITAVKKKESTTLGTIVSETILSISTPYSDTVLGESIAVNGVCLTVAAVHNQCLLDFFVSPETLKKTNLGTLSEGDAVNLERALRLSDRLSGHMVQGHVDGTATLKAIHPQSECTELVFELSPDLAKYAIPKGSITVDGISLTINEITKTSTNTDICLMIIPHTWQETTLKHKRVGQIFNIESDVIAKMVEKFVQTWENNVRNA